VLQYDLVELTNKHAEELRRKGKTKTWFSVKTVACTVAGGFLAAYHEYFFMNPRLTMIIAGGVASVYVIIRCMRKEA